MTDTILSDLADQHAELAGLLDGLDATESARPTPCEGWSVADVVLHLAQTDEMALGSATGRFAETLEALAGDLRFAADVDEGADRLVAAQRDLGPDRIVERWALGTAALRAAFAAIDPSERLTWVAGQLSARTLATTRLAETWIHTGDVATALDRDLAPTPRLRHIARLAWRTLPYAFTQAGLELTGPVALRLVGPDGEQWNFEPNDEGGPATVIRGPALDLCRVAARRVDPSTTALLGTGPDAEHALRLIRTYA